MKTLRNWLLVIAACALAAGGLGYYKYRQIQAGIAAGAAYPEPSESVEVHVVRSVPWQALNAVPAQVIAIRAVDLSSELAGRIVEVGVAPGGAVQRDQVLVRLDTSEERAQLAAAQADAALARVDLTRAERILGSGAGTVENRDQARARHDAALAQVERLQAIIAKKTVRAPFDGVAGLHQLEVGQYLDNGAAIVRLVGDTMQVWVDFSLPQQQAAPPLGASVDIVLPPDRTLPARVIAHDAAVDEDSRNRRVRALADNQDGLLVPGMLVSVEVPAGPPREATLVPATSVRRDTLGASVYVLEPAQAGAPARERARRRTVVVGPQREGMVVISQGLAAGERVAANGAFKLRDGMLVHAVPAGDAALSEAAR